MVDERIRPSNDRRLELTGHSLGGGLASAVCAILDRRYPDVHCHAMIFNPSGVHPNTIQPASPADGLIDGFAIKNEILTTLQSYPSHLPIVGSLFRLAQRTINQNGMPEPLGTLLVTTGISPGQYKEQWRVPAKGEELATLFPINEQNLIPPVKPNGFPELNRLDKMLSSSPATSVFVDHFLEHLNSAYRVQAKATVERWYGFAIITDIYKEMLRYYEMDLEPELKALAKITEAAVSYHGMDYVIATYENYFGTV